MATTSNPGGETNPDAAITETQPATPETNYGRAGSIRDTNYGRTGGTIARKPTARKSPSGISRRPTSTRTRSKQPRTPVEQAQAIAERAVLVPIGATLVARDNLVRTVKSLAPKYTTRSGLQREIKRYERRGVTERNRFERQVRHTRSRLEDGVQHRRSNVEKTVRENRRRLEREVGKQGDAVSKRVDKLVSDAQGLIGNSAS